MIEKSTSVTEVLFYDSPYFKFTKQIKQPKKKLICRFNYAAETKHTELRYNRCHCH